MNRRQIISSAAAAALLTAVLVPASASAQGFSAGVKGGLNVARLTFNFADVNPVKSSRNGLIIGGFVAKDGAKFGVAAEVLYSEKGGTLDFSSPGQISTAEVRLDYVDIPILARYNFTTSKTVVHVYGGPVFSFSVKDEETDTDRASNAVNPPPPTTQDAGAESSDIGIAVGGQFDVRKFVIDARYTWGLKDIFKGDPEGDPKVKNNVFSIMFGFRFK